jgi:hypothetical protein
MMTDTKVNPFVRQPIGFANGKPIFSIRGADGPSGYNTEGDLLQRTADGRDLNELWVEFNATLSIFNERRTTIVDALTFPVQSVIEDVPQVGSFDFDDASEFGVPTGTRVELSIFSLGYDFRDYDKATRFTWRFLRDAPASHIEAIHNGMLEADNRLLFRRVMEALFDNRNRNANITGQNYTVYALYNNDGTVPPPYKNTTFASTHTHYTVSGGVLIDSGDLEAQYSLIAEHGYGAEQGTTFVYMANAAIVNQIRKFRVGVVNNNSVVANYDFIPSATQPTMIIPNSDGLLGSLPPTTWNGLPVVGSYMGILIIQEDYIPAGYGLMVGSGGLGNLQNPVGIREHANAAYRGLRLVPGNQVAYPLTDSTYCRAFGTGIRQRAGAAVMQYKVGNGTFTDYDIPAVFQRGNGNG